MDLWVTRKSEQMFLCVISTTVVICGGDSVTFIKKNEHGEKSLNPGLDCSSITLP